MRLKAALIAAAVVGGALLDHGAAQADGEIAVAIVAVDDSNFPLVTAVFTVDDRGRPVTSLTSTEVAATESGAPAAVVSLQAATDAAIPLALVVAIDTSGSMAGASIGRAREAAASLVNSLGPGDSAALVTFADGVQLRHPLATSRAEVTNALMALKAAGNTALYDAVAESAGIAADSGHLRRAVVLLSDGEDFGGRSKLTREQSLVRVTAGGALFYVIGVGAEIDRAYLEEVASRSGGQFLQAHGAADIPAIYASLEQLLRSQFVATVQAASPAGLQERSLTLAVRTGAAEGSASRGYQSQRAAEATPLAEPVAVAAPTRAAPQEASPSVPGASPDRLGTGVPLSLMLLPAALLAAAAGVWLRGSRRPRVSPAAAGALEMEAAPPASANVRSHGALFLSQDGSVRAAVDLSAGPVTLGSGPGCEIRLPEAADVSAEHARIWLRDHRPMLHHLAPGFVTAVNGKGVTFASLDNGDEIAIGPYVLSYAAPGEPVPQRASHEEAGGAK